MSEVRNLVKRRWWLSLLALPVLAMEFGCKSPTQAPAPAVESEVQVFQKGNLRGRGRMSRGQLALTVDDGPSPATTDLLNKLARFNSAGNCRAPVTFFVTGQQVTKTYRDRYLKHFKTGCYLIGNHTKTHKLKRLRTALQAELVGGHNAIKTILNTQKGAVRFFRAPGGTRINVRVANAARIPDYVGSVVWDVGGSVHISGGVMTDSADWPCWKKRYSTSKCLVGYKNRTKAVGKGIVLFHDLNRKSVPLIIAYIDWALGQKYKLIRLDKIPAFRRMAKTFVGGGSGGGSTGGGSTGGGSTGGGSTGGGLDPSSPCKSRLKGACVSRGQCLDMGAAKRGDRTYTSKFENANLS